MRNRTKLLAGFLLASLIVALVPPLALEAAPAAQSGNLLQIPGFDADFSNGVAQPWAKWHEERECKERDDLNYSCEPDWYPEQNSALIRGGWQAQGIGVRYTPWHGGVMQTVNVAPGTRVRLTAWGRIHASNDNYPAPSDTSVDGRLKVGIDPEGAGIWYQNVTWSGKMNPHDTWQSVSVEATAGASGKVTVYLSANFGGYSRAHMDVKWDDAVLEVVSAPTSTPVPQPTSPPATAVPAQPVATNTPAPTSTPEPTATPEASATPTNTPEPTATPTPMVGTICVTAFDDGNQNGAQDGIEGPISGVTITLFDGQEIVGTQTTNALAGQLCFENLQPGPYQVFQTVPPSRVATTADNVAVELQPGQPIMVLFGSAVQTASPAEPTAVADGGQASPTESASATTETAQSAGGRSLGETILAISGVLVLLVAAVLVAVYFVFRNR